LVSESIIPQGITDFVGFEAPLFLSGLLAVLTGLGIFVIEGVGVLSVTAGLDGAFVVRGADVAASLGDVEGTGVVSSETRVSEDVHPVSTRAVAIITPAIAEFLFMLVLSSAQWG
jgi:hypothetical protein